MQLQISYIKCPHCEKWYSHSKVMSYTISGASECWSDGKCINNNLSEHSFLPYSKCNECNHFFWIEDCEQIDFRDLQIHEETKKQNTENKNIINNFLLANPDFDINKGIPSSSYPPPSHWFELEKSFINDYKEILGLDICKKTDREIYIRTKLWQTINDFTRDNLQPLKKHLKLSKKLKSYSLLNFKQLWSLIKTSNKNKKLFDDYNTVRTKNLQKLLELFNLPDLRNEDTDIIKIEILRELGNLDLSKAEINNISSESKYHNKIFIDKSLKQIAQKSTKVFEIN